MGRKKLLFVSPRFLFPADSGGNIRTGQILRGMKGGPFDITLASPAPRGAQETFPVDLGAICDRFTSWPEAVRDKYFSVTRLRHLVSSLPVSVATDRSKQGRAVVARKLERRPDIVVFDFVHSVALAPDSYETRSVLFTHNVETEIFKRHAAVATNPVARAIWTNQHRKMWRFERETLRRNAAREPIRPTEGRDY